MDHARSLAAIATACVAFALSPLHAAAVCPDGMIDGMEVCDGADLGGETCTSQGFTEGTLQCAASCDAFVTSLCTTCGNGVCEFSETVTGCPADCSQTDDFQDGTTQGWVTGPMNGSAPFNVADNGPTGTGDHALAAEDGGNANRLVFFNTTTWTGDWFSRGRTTIYAHVRNVGTDPLSLRISLEGGGGRVSTLAAVTVPADRAVHTVSWDVSTSGVMELSVPTPELVLRNVSQFRINHSTTTSFMGDPVHGFLVIDNISDRPLAPICGDGVMNGSDACDDGNVTSEDGCSATCVVEFCGDGVTQAGLDEMCDDAGSNSDSVADACRTNCMDASCGDGVMDTGEACDDGGSNSDSAADACRTSCMAASCGDGVTDTGEQCDDGGTTPGDGCDASCMTEAAPDMGTPPVDAGASGIDAGVDTPDMGTDVRLRGSSCAAGHAGTPSAGGALLLLALGLFWRRRR